MDLQTLVDTLKKEFTVPPAEHNIDKIREIISSCTRPRE